MFTPLFQCLSEETLKAVGPFYLVSMPGEAKDPTHNSEINNHTLAIEWAVSQENYSNFLLQYFQDKLLVTPIRTRTYPSTRICYSSTLV